ncbi:hypothetical protein [Demequina sp. NBRC 110056]|uniref:hypothetical protein n=1 Tax=Demequina sp. NBRC 110056 TaxID=1570345 RepID=UPI0009FC35B5|nr:hypothetical protein [Demequina sp. NBRC 110056]
MSAAEPSPQDASAPTTETLATTPRMPLSVRLIGRSSLPGAAIVAAIAMVLVAGVPMLASWLAEPAAEEEAVSAGTLEVTLAQGWSVDGQESGVTTLVQGSSTLTLEVTTSDADDLEASVAARVEDLASDESANWVSTDPVEYTADDGHPGATVSATSETRSTQVWIAVYGEFATVATLVAPVESWAATQPSAEDMVMSLTLTDESADAPASDAPAGGP